jgi:hypothetical protein
LRCDRCIVHLEQILFEFLCFLVYCSGRIVSRSESVERAWGQEAFLEAKAASTPTSGG